MKRGGVRSIWYLAVWGVKPVVITHAAQVNVMCDRYKLMINMLLGVMQGSWKTFAILGSSHHMQGVRCMW